MTAYIALIFPIIFINRAVSLSCFDGIEVYVGGTALNKVVALNECSTTNASICLSASVNVPQPNHAGEFLIYVFIAAHLHHLAESKTVR